MTVDEFFDLGETIELGSHTFDADEIKRFAAKYDPQRFHLDDEAARRSVFGSLCASGWHSAATWMKFNAVYLLQKQQIVWPGPGPKPAAGPSPGLRDLKWLLPVYAGDTISYTRKTVSIRDHQRRPGWKIMTVYARGYNAKGDDVLEFHSGEFIDVGGGE